MIILNRIILVLLGCSMLLQANSQTDKRLVLADKLFSQGDYYTAANLYQQFLEPPVKKKNSSDFPLNANRNAEGKTGKSGSREDIMYRQAESYRLAHYWKEAAVAYKKTFEADPAKHADALYWYAVCQRSLGNYEDARESIKLFLSNNASASSYEQAAKNEQLTLDFILAQMKRADLPLFSVEKLQSPLGNEKGLFAPAAQNDQMIVTSTQTRPAQVNINPYVNRLFAATITANALQQQMPLVFESLDSTFNQGAASISADTRYLYLTQWRNNEPPAIYVAAKTGSGWSQPKLLSINMQGASTKQPFCTADGKYLFFASDRTGGKGGYDIWYAPLKEDGTTGNAVNAGGINTSANELSPFHHLQSNTMVFSTDRIGGMGGYDLYSAKGEINAWQAAENMGYPVNSSRDDMYFVATGKNLLDKAYFSSDRGMECCLALYQVSKAGKKKALAGIVRDCRDASPLADALVVLKDVSGKTLEYRTGEDGRYSFALAADELSEISITKPKYEGKNSGVSIDSVNHSAWHTDTLMSSTICLEKKLVIKVENVVTVYFDFDRSAIKERGSVQLDSIYNVLMMDTLATIQISGYTDGLGSAEYNAKLSDRRAKACADYLVQKGINPSRISFASFGACCPVEMELINGRDNPDGRSMNRRALINIERTNVETEE